MYIQFAAPTTVNNIVAELGGKAKVKKYKPMTTKETQFVPVGPNYGVGAAFGWWIPSAVVRMVKSKNMFFPKAMQVRIYKFQRSFSKRTSSIDSRSARLFQGSSKRLIP